MMDKSPDVAWLMVASRDGFQKPLQLYFEDFISGVT
jgi:hypothetical protein